MGVFTFIDAIHNKQLFQYVVITLIVLFFFLKISIGLNIILSLIISIGIIFYLNEKENVETLIDEKQDSIKYETIKPKLNKLNFDTDSDIVDFLFSIQDFYVYNPEAYEEMIDNLNSFYTLIENTFNEPTFCTYYYQIAFSKKNNALNSLQSLIFNLPTEAAFNDKFNRAHERLETILNKKMNDLYDECEKHIFKNGRNTVTTPLMKGPQGYNVFNDEEYSYQFY
jgi:hypothetical protein